MTLRIHKIASLIISVAFFALLSVFIFGEFTEKLLLVGFAFYIAATALYNAWYLRSQKLLNLWIWLAPVLFLICWYSLFYFLPTSFLRIVYALAGIPLIYFWEVLFGSLGEQVLFNKILLTAFCFFIATTAASQYYKLYGTLYLALIFLFTTLITRCSYELTPQSSRIKWLGSLVIGLFATELFWSLQLLPLHYSALAIIQFSLFYCYWALYYYYLFNHLSPKKIQFHLVLAIVIIGIVLASTPWKIIAQ